MGEFSPLGINEFTEKGAEVLLDYAKAKCNNYTELEAIRNHSIVVQETTIKEKEM